MLCEIYKQIFKLMAFWAPLSLPKYEDQDQSFVKVTVFSKNQLLTL